MAADSTGGGYLTAITRGYDNFSKNGMPEPRNLSPLKFPASLAIRVEDVWTKSLALLPVVQTPDILRPIGQFRKQPVVLLHQPEQRD